jgi:amino acid adenylation domain-containing protein
MVFHQQADPSGSCYMQRYVARLAASVQITRLARAWNQLAARHEALRTAFEWDAQGRLRQRVVAHAALPLHLEDWSDLTPHERAERLRTSSAPIAPGQAPLHRLELFIDDANAATLSWVSHHAVMDGGARAVLLDELFRLCSAAYAPLPPAPSWIDFVRGAGAQPADTAGFWQRYLGNQRTLTCGAAVSSVVSTKVQSISEQLDTGGLYALCRSADVTPTNVLHAAWGLTLSRLLGHRSAVFGAVRACRHGSRLVGLMINTVPIRVNIDAARTVVAWLQQLRQEWLMLREYERTPLTETRFDTLVNIDPPRAALPQIDSWELQSHTNHPIFLKLSSELRLELQYHADRVAPAFASMLLGQVVATLSAMAAAPHEKVGALRLPSTPAFDAPPKYQIRQTPDAAIEISADRFASVNTKTTESAVRAAWEQVLGIAGVSRDDNFFVRGGDSLSMLRMVAEVTRAVGRPLPVGEVMKDPTVAGIAAWLERALPPAAEPQPPHHRPPVRAAEAHAAHRHPAPAVQAGVTQACPPAGLSIVTEPLQVLSPQLDAAAIGYLPDWLEAASGMSQADILRTVGTKPYVSRVLLTATGTIGVITLPVFSHALYDDGKLLRGLMDDAMALASRLRAAAVSWTGLLPSALDYGRSFPRTATATAEWPALTTGHGATAATVLMNLRHLLDATGRSLARERLAVLGLGSIGRAVLGLALRCLRPPRALILCDVPARLSDLRGWAEDLGYRGELHTAAFDGAMPDIVYGASVIIGATNAPEVLDVARLAPGTLVIDDSAPYCFSERAAHQRCEQAGDVILIEAGHLNVPDGLRQISYVPALLQQRLEPADLLRLTYFDAERSTGCIVSSLLTARYGDATIGPPDTAHGERWLRRLEELGYEAPTPRLGGRTYSRHDLDHVLRTARPASVGVSSAPAAATIHDVFRAVAAARPDAIALIEDEREVTYAELDRLSDTVAATLAARGVEPGHIVALHLPRSIEMVACMLGVLKSGAAYTPLDRANPRSRLEYQLQETGVRYLLGELRVEGIETIDPREAAAERRGRVPRCSVGPEDVAYVMYTSGTTGRPKGVAMPHRGVTRLVHQPDWILLRTDDVFLNMASPAFDWTVVELFGSLLNGASCVIYRPDRLDLALLRDVVSRHRVNTMVFTTSVFHAVVDLDVGLLDGVSRLLVGGERMSASHLRRAQAALPGSRVYNLYGPTESIVVTCWTADAQLPAEATEVPIGRPLSGCTVHVLDENQRPVAPGIEGELCIGGTGLAHGYYGRAELTAQKFVAVPGLGRVYRTGDLARWRADGNLDFLGRRDRQIKLRGFRIELDEIETVLRQHEAVREAAVLLREHASGQRLEAWIEASRSSADIANEVLAHVQRSLPPYMVPSAIQVLERLPVMTNGKLDRNALPTSP